MGALSYADDLTIPCPSLYYYGLNIILHICNNFAHDNFITFNKKKTVFMQPDIFSNQFKSYFSSFYGSFS